MIETLKVYPKTTCSKNAKINCCCSFKGTRQQKPKLNTHFRLNLSLFGFCFFWIRHWIRCNYGFEGAPQQPPTTKNNQNYLKVTKSPATKQNPKKPHCKIMNFIVHEINTKTTARELSKVKKYVNVRIVTTLLSAALIENGT
jgi:hypothetical protein